MLIIDNTVAVNNVFRMMAVISVAGETVFNTNILREMVFWRKKLVYEENHSSWLSVIKLKLTTDRLYRVLFRNSKKKNIETNVKKL